MPSRLRADFTPDEMAAVLDRYDLGVIRDEEKQTRGSRRSPKVILTTDHGKYLLKRRARGRDHPLKVSYAHGVQQHLAERGFPLPRLVRSTVDDDTMVMLNGHLYEVFEYITGVPYDRSPEATHDSGRVLGLFHDIAVEYESDWEPSRRGYHNANVVRNHLNTIPPTMGKHDSVVGKETKLFTTVSVLYDSYETAAETIDDAGWSEWPVQTVHSDWHPGNMLFAKHRVVAVIDYDSLHLLPPITDLANGVLQFSILGGQMDPRLWPPGLDEERFVQFLRGYDEESDIPPDQLQALPALMIQALIAEAVAPIAATGSFGQLEGFRFLQMICRKVQWLEENGERLMTLEWT